VQSAGSSILGPVEEPDDSEPAEISVDPQSPVVPADDSCPVLLGDPDDDAAERVVDAEESAVPEVPVPGEDDEDEPGGCAPVLEVATESEPFSEVEPASAACTVGSQATTTNVASRPQLAPTDE